MTERIAMEAPIADDGKTRVVRWFRARKMFGLWWSRQAVTRSALAMFGAWEGLAQQERADHEVGAQP